MSSTSWNDIRLSLEAPYKDHQGTYIPRLQDITPDGELVYDQRHTPAEKLSGQLRQLIQERGLEFFENLNQESLTEEARGKMELEDDDKASDEEEEEVAPQAAQEDKRKTMTTAELTKMRERMIPTLVQAQDEMTMARDLVSLILATALPAIPQSLHPELAAMPTGSFSSSTISKLPPLPSVQAFDAQLTVGGKDEALRKASAVFKTAAESTERALGNIERYWNDALEVRAGNWNLLPAPLSGGLPVLKNTDKTARDFVISFGLEESPPLFKRRAIAQLSTDVSDASGPLSFPHYRQRTRLRVSLVVTNPDGARTMATTSRRAGENLSLNALLSSLQEEFIEQEIFVELIKDAGNLPSAAARVSERRLIVEAAQDLELRFELVDEDKIEQPEIAPAIESEADLICSLIHAALPLLLLRTHNHLRNQRLAPPTTVRTNTPPTRPPPILQGIIDLLQYQSFCDRVQEQLDNMVRGLNDAGIGVSLRFVRLAEAAEELVSMLLQGAGIGLDLRGGKSRAGGEAVLRVDNRQSLRFILQPPSTLIAHLPQSTLPIASTPQLRQLLIHEVGKCLLNKIGEIGEVICSGQRKVSWFADGIAGKCVGIRDGLDLHFKLSFGALFNLSCEAVTTTKSLTTPRVDSYVALTALDSVSLFDWVRGIIEEAIHA